MKSSPNITHPTYVLGLSGGPDSVYLLHWLMNEKKLCPAQIVAAHLDHQWRGNSDQDVLFCKQLCQQLNITFVSACMSELDWNKPKRGSREEIARAARRHFLESVVQSCHAKGIYLAHHLDDQQETFLLRIIRGASLTGLTCMKEQAGSYIRPLLQMKKTKIIAFLDAHNIPYLNDPTNATDDFLRNRIRNHVLPALRATDQRFDTNFSLTLSRLQQTEIWIDSIVEASWSTIFYQNDKGLQVALAPLLACDQPLLERLLLKWFIVSKVSFVPSSAFFAELIRFLRQPGSKLHQIRPCWSVKKTKDLAYIVKTS